MTTVGETGNLCESLFMDSRRKPQDLIADYVTRFEQECVHDTTWRTRRRS